QPLLFRVLIRLLSLIVCRLIVQLMRFLRRFAVDVLQPRLSLALAPISIRSRVAFATLQLVSRGNPPKRRKYPFLAFRVPPRLSCASPTILLNAAFPFQRLFYGLRRLSLQPPPRRRGFLSPVERLTIAFGIVVRAPALNLRRS